MRVIPCGNRGQEVALTRLENGKPVHVYQCQEFGVCTLEADGLARQGAPLAVCQGCSAWVEVTDSDQRALPCVHRLEVLREEKCTLCGSAAGPKGTIVQIFGCSEFGECAPVFYKSGQRAKSCSTCAKFTPLVQLSIPAASAARP